ncbi:MAG: hypothetical protein ABJE10_16400 [bacterium]
MRSRLIAIVLAASLLTPRAGFTQRVESPEQWIARGNELYAASRYRESIAAFERGMQLRTRGASEAAWQVARAYAQLDNRKQALRWLTHARQLGFRNERAIQNEPAFDKYRDDAVFRELVVPSVCVSCRGEAGRSRSS